MPTDKVTLTLIEAPRGCRKCEACLAMIQRLQERWPGRVELKTIMADAPEAADYGLIMPPMLLLGDFIVATGKVPLESGLVKLVARELGEESPQ